LEQKEWLAKEWQQALINGRNISLADLSRKLGLTRSRVTQIMNLLKLSPEIIEIIFALGDPISVPHVTERTLRKFVDLSVEEQKTMIQKIIVNSQIAEAHQFDSP
jgi:ParB-like chromosome segregation protein Spo0J